ncbi:MAG TPA: [LysW]-lysine hydrolase [Aggregatilineales bacterium]|nr:[LysW]-lysine hydrolase [Aggregatilineales bacterium]
MSEVLIELVKRYSPSQMELPAVRFLTEWMNAHGFNARIDEAGNAFGIRGDGDAAHILILLGHIDTVPGEITVRVEDGKLYGRGSVDAKGSLAAFADAASRASIPAGWRVIVVGAVEEEVASSKGAHHIRERFNPDFCIIGEPSSADRITLGYKGRLLVEYNLRRTVSHTARPEPSAGAMGATFWQRVSDWADTENEGVERFFDQVMPSLRSINTTSDYFLEQCNMTVAFRLPTRLTPQDVFQTISGFITPGGELRSYGLEHAYEGGRNNALVRLLMGAIRSRGGQPGFVLKTGTSDMNVVGAKWNCPIVAYGPGDSNLDHTPNEHLPLDEYERAVQTLQHVIENLPTA